MKFVKLANGIEKHEQKDADFGAQHQTEFDLKLRN